MVFEQNRNEREEFDGDDLNPLTALETLEDKLQETLYSNDPNQIKKGLSLIHELAHLHELPRSRSLARDFSGRIFVIKEEQRPFADEDCLEEVPAGDETLKLLVPYIQRNAEIFILYRADYDEEESLSWLAEHNICHLYDYGGAEFANLNCGLYIDRIE